MSINIADNQNGKGNKCKFYTLFFLIFCLFSGTVFANNLKFYGPWNTQDINLTRQNTIDGTVKIGFDVSWDNSWRKENDTSNWDACWIFVKYRKKGTEKWNHATLGTRSRHHDAPAGASIAPGATDGVGKGVFIFRSEKGSGSVNFQNVRLLWQYGMDKVGDDLEVDLQIMGIEMVYIPQGAFELGTTTAMDVDFYGEIFGSFENYNPSCREYDNAPFTIDSEAGFFLGGSSSKSMGNNNAVNMYTPDDFDDTTRQWLPDEFPKGFAAFYMMKYEISQGQYVDFLNLLTTDQRKLRDNSNIGNYRNKITGSITEGYTTTRPDRACNYLSWSDGAAYTDWSGLRPFTELEFEKACRGTKPSVPNEYAWGTTNGLEGVSIQGKPEDGTETILDDQGGFANVNCYVDGFVGGDADGSTENSQGPLRGGIFAASGDGSREMSGAGYYGVMELSGNVLERPISLGNRKGRSFTGTHGDGEITDEGEADVTTWPRPDAIGAGFRGGHLFRGSPALRVSDRRYAAHVLDYRRGQYGFRAARTAP